MPRCVLLYDGKFLYEYDYQNMEENSKCNLLEMNETKLAINAAYCKKFEVIVLEIIRCTFYCAKDGSCMCFVGIYDCCRKFTLIRSIQWGSTTSISMINCCWWE